MMKVVLLLCAMLAVAFGATCIRDDTDGQPQCNAVEVAQRYWRNNWDPTAYWECTGVGAAIARRCPTEGMFSSAVNACINWFDWEWTPTCLPPSRV